MPPSDLLSMISSLMGATAVMTGAFGAHGLKKTIADPGRLKSWETAAHYQLLHSVMAFVAAKSPLASWLFVTGNILFSGSIYMLVLNPERYKFLGPVTPIGGLCYIAGWLALAFRR